MGWLTSLCLADFDPIWIKIELFGAEIVPVAWTQLRQSLGWSVVVFLDKSGRVVDLGASIEPMSAMMDEDQYNNLRGNVEIVLIFEVDINAICN